VTADRIVLDTNCYIQAQRDPSAWAELRQFLDGAADLIVLSSVVRAELRIGARSDADVDLFHEQLLEPWTEDDRLVVPGAESWQRAAAAFAELRGYGDRSTMSRGFAFDVLIAASCVEHNALLVTHNVRDMQRIASVLPFEFSAPYPTLQ
jgi:predicted nucleic acid-binding protein